MPVASGFQPVIHVELNAPWEKVLAQGTSLSFPAKTIISSTGSGEAALGLYYIRRGRIRLSNITAGGQENCMLYMGKGTIFNEIPMLHMGNDYLFTCLEPTDAIFFPKKRITAGFIRDHPELILNLLESMGKKSRSFYSRLWSLRAYGTFVNVCRTLYSMHIFNRTGRGIVPRLTQQELAAFLGLHRSSLHKALSRLKEEGIIGPYSRNRLDIYSLERLLGYAGDEDA